MKLYCSQEANHVQTSKSLHYTSRHLPLHLIYEAAFQSLSISHTIEWRHYNLAAGVLSLWLGKYDLLRWKKDLYRNKKRCVETYQIQSTRLSDGVPLAVTKVIVLRFISVERGQNRKVETKERRRGSAIVFRELIIIRQRSCMWAYWKDSSPQTWKYLFSPLIHLDCFGVSCRALEVSAVKLSAFPQSWRNQMTIGFLCSKRPKKYIWQTRQQCVFALYSG